MFPSASRKIIPALALELLGTIVGRIHDFCGLLEEENLRANFVLIYELIDEIIVSLLSTFLSNDLSLWRVGLWAPLVDRLRGLEALRDVGGRESIQWYTGLPRLANPSRQASTHRQCKRERK